MLPKNLKFSNSSINSPYSKENLINSLQSLRDIVVPSFDKIVEIKFKKSIKFEEKAKLCLFDLFIDIVCGLLSSKLPLNISEIDNRLLRLKIKPNTNELESLRNNAIKGKKGKFCLPFDKILKVNNNNNMIIL